MTRRERHMRIIGSWGHHSSSTWVGFHVSQIMSKHGLAAFKDEMIEELARSLLKSRARQIKMNAENKRKRTG